MKVAVNLTIQKQNILPPIEQVQTDWKEMFEIMGVDSARQA